MRRFGGWFVVPMLVGLLLLLTLDARAERFDPKQAPEPLRPWTSWVLAGNALALCPSMQGSAEVLQCTWPTALLLDLSEKVGHFEQHWHLDARAWVPLPGDLVRWPLNVTEGGKKLVVVEQSGVPSVELEPGEHTIVGAFAWDSLPDALQVPPETGIVSLLLEGARIGEPRRDEAGRIFLQKSSVETEGERLEIVVHRRVTDSLPLLLTTRVVLNVSGKSRELVLGKALPPGFIPMSISSELPARIEPDTRLRVQARPGTWTIEIAARSEGPVAELSRPTPDGPWRDGEEVWVFDAKSELRLTSVEGVRAIDPQQTLLPDQWKTLPSYAMALGDKMRLVEKRRGDVEPEPERLSLTRALWLDFAGAGYTVNDLITGTVHRATRLEMQPPTLLGRVAIDGIDQFITHLDKDPSKAGVEIRQGEHTISADSRITGEVSDIPAVGYDHDFHEVSATLHIPPGFRLFHASGADEVPGTWIRHWTLLELFLVLVLSLAFAKLFGRAWGALACLTFTLVFPETDSARWLWAAALVTEALARVIPAGKARVVCSVLRLGALLCLLLSTLPFVVQHVREGIYPALAEHAAGGDSMARGGELFGAKTEAMAPPPLEPAPAAAAAPPTPGGGEVLTGGVDQGVLRGGGVPTIGRTGSSSRAANKDDKQFNDVYDPNAMVQTGPGLPSWNWSTSSVTFSGPVERTQRLHFYFLSPSINLLLAVLRAVLLTLLFARLLPFGSARLPGFGRPAAALAALLLVFLLAPAARAEIPPDTLLEQYKARLLAKPDCTPSCASSSRMLLDVHGNVLRARLAIEVSATTAVPLPGEAAQWSPERVLVDGRPAQGLFRSKDGQLWLRLAPGAHDVSVEGALPHREALQIALPLKPHHVQVDIEGWSLEGLHEDGLADAHLQLTRAVSEGKGAGAALAAGSLPPFVRVERTLMIGLNWQVSTRIVRVTPVGSAIVLEVPLLHGESVTTPDVRIVAGKVLVNMAPDASEMSFQSVLEQHSPIALVAPQASGWVEVWRLDLSSIWHATVEGIPVVHGEAGARLPEWRPWPNETVLIHLLRPAGISGQTLTIDHSSYELHPGLRATDATMAFSLRSSRGGEHVLHLPEGATLESLAVNGKRQPLRQQGRNVTLSIVPGLQTFQLTFRSPQGISTWFRAPPFDFGIQPGRSLSPASQTVNATTSIRLSDSRWVLFAHGPRLGPAVLFWSLLLVLVLVALGLGRIPWVPLKRYEWMLLTIGLSQIPLPAAALVIGWLVALGFRRAHPAQRPYLFDLGQLALVGWTLTALGILVYAVQQGLMGTPDMQIQGNGSSSELLQWFDDRTGPIPEQPYVLSVPMLAYRGAMLAWALWLAVSLLRWLRWGWLNFSDGGFWKRGPKRVPKATSMPATPPAQVPAEPAAPDAAPPTPDAS